MATSPIGDDLHQDGDGPTPAADPQSPDVAGEPTDEAATDPSDDDGNNGRSAPRWPLIRLQPRRLTILISLVMAIVLSALVGWLGWRTYQSHQAEEQRALFLQVGRQGAVNLTTIDWQHADADVARILGSATGTFYDDFSQRSQPFVDVVKKAQSRSVGTVTAAGLESSSATDAQVLVAVSVQTTNGGAPPQGQRAWRMRISVQKLGDDVKVSHVEFVP